MYFRVTQLSSSGTRFICLHPFLVTCIFRLLVSVKSSFAPLFSLFPFFTPMDFKWCNRLHPSPDLWFGHPWAEPSACNYWTEEKWHDTRIVNGPKSLLTPTKAVYALSLVLVVTEIAFRLAWFSLLLYSTFLFYFVSLVNSRKVDSSMIIGGKVIFTSSSCFFFFFSVNII